MKIELDVLNRILCLGFAPAKGDRTLLRMVHEYETNLSFTEEEYKEWEMKAYSEKEGSLNYMWNSSKAKTKEFDFSEIQIGWIVDGLLKLNKDKELTKQHMWLWDKFNCDEKEKEEKTSEK